MARRSLGVAVLVTVRAGDWVPEQNPSCWTDGYTYAHCCGRESAPDCFPGGDLPHSYERCCRSPCGPKLRQRIEELPRSLCPRRRFSNSTLVTGLWNLHREGWPSHARYEEGDGHSFKKYFGWMDQLLQKQQALVIFADAETIAFAAAQRRKRNHMLLSCLVEVPKEELPQMRWRRGYEEAHAQNMRDLPGDMRPEVIQSTYTMVVNSKPELLGCAAHWNPFRSRTFAWVDAGVAREGKIDNGFPGGQRPIVLPQCNPWTLCVARRMWLLWDFRDKLKRLKHGTTYDSSVLLGGREGVLLYVLWFQWAIQRYLDEKIMDDEQSIIAEIWWTGLFQIQGFYGMGWAEVLARMLMADAPYGTGGSPESLDHASTLGRWFGDTPTLIWRNTGSLWVPTDNTFEFVEQKTVNRITDDEMELLVYGSACANAQIPRLKSLCEEQRARAAKKMSGAGLIASCASTRLWTKIAKNVYRLVC